MPSMTEDEITAKMENLQSQYTMQQYLLPVNYDDALFIRAKKRYILKRKNSEMLDNNPDADIKPMIKELKEI